MLELSRNLHVFLYYFWSLEVYKRKITENGIGKKKNLYCKVVNQQGFLTSTPTILRKVTKLLRRLEVTLDSNKIQNQS